MDSRHPAPPRPVSPPAVPPRPLLSLPHRPISSTRNQHPHTLLEPAADHPAVQQALPPAQPSPAAGPAMSGREQRGVPDRPAPSHLIPATCREQPPFLPPGPAAVSFAPTWASKFCSSELPTTPSTVSQPGQPPRAWHLCPQLCFPPWDLCGSRPRDQGPRTGVLNHRNPPSPVPVPEAGVRAWRRSPALRLQGAVLPAAPAPGGPRCTSIHTPSALSLARTLVSGLGLR